MQSVRLFARLGDGTLRRAVRSHTGPQWRWVTAQVSGPTSTNGDVVLVIDRVEDLPTGPSQVGKV